ncbi:MAG TPA: DUF692 family protein [Pyrinomonadaceae bacterium]
MAALIDGRRLGIGASYSVAIEPLIERHPELFDVLEIEPQTLWIKTTDNQGPSQMDPRLLAHLASLPGRKIVHSVGRPVGGTLPPEEAELNLLRQTVVGLDAVWASDHLSFNQTKEFATGFFLPPRQTLAGVESAAASVRRLKSALSVPIAIETGVSYLRPRNDELPDGEFVARVAERADCGILLDLHNIYCNSVNGRQPVEIFVDQLPLERVWEVHVAGGFELDGFYLDAHSGAIAPALHKMLEGLIGRLPNLRAIIFEIFPSFVPMVGLDLVREQLEWLHDCWNRARDAVPTPGNVTGQLTESQPRSDGASPVVWERALGRLVIGLPADDAIGIELAQEPGVKVIERLIHEFRSSMIVRVLPLTSRFIMLSMGTDAFRVILDDYWSKVTPQMYASNEARAFADYLKELNLGVPHLSKILEFEVAVTSTNIDGITRIVHFDSEPLPLLRAISEGRLPTDPPQAGNFEIEITPDLPTGVSGPDQDSLIDQFSFH